MITAARFRELALGFEGTTEVPHMERAAFRTTRRIFVTLAADEQSANLALTPELQELFVRGRPGQFTVIPNGWGAQGWTTAHLALVEESALKDALRAAHGLARPAPTPSKKATTKQATTKKATTKQATKKQATTKKIGATKA